MTTRPVRDRTPRHWWSSPAKEVFHPSYEWYSDLDKYILPVKLGTEEEEIEEGAIEELLTQFDEEDL